MSALTLNTRRDLLFVQETVSTEANTKGSEWSHGEILGVLIDFCAAQWEHLEELRGEDRWLQSLPNESPAARESELHALLKALLQAEPPARVASSLHAILRQTEELAAAYVAQAAKGELDGRMLKILQGHQDGLEATKTGLQEIERKLHGAVPPIPARFRGPPGVTSHQKAK